MTLGRVGLILLTLLAPRAATAADCSTPDAGADGWQVAAPADVGMDAATLCAIVPRFDGWKQANVHSALVIRHDRLVFEHYFEGPAEVWGVPIGNVRFGPAVRHEMHSITKSVTSLVLGIAIGRGWIAGVDVPVLSLLPQYADLATAEKQRITLRHLLTMSAGLAWDETLPYTDPANDNASMIIASDPYRYVLERPVAAPPGRVYDYSGGGPTLIAAALRAATGKTVDVLAQELLFAPLGISDVAWSRFPRNDTPRASGGLLMRPRDLAKLGQLVLNHGRWGERQVVPAAWLEESMAPHIQGASNFFYGYLWWLGRSLVDGHEVSWSAGAGWAGQRLFIVPEYDLVVVVTAGMYHNDMDYWLPSQILNRNVLAAVQGGKP